MTPAYTILLLFRNIRSSRNKHKMYCRNQLHIFYYILDLVASKFQIIYNQFCPNIVIILLRMRYSTESE